MLKPVTEKDLTQRSYSLVWFFGLGLLLSLVMGWIIFPWLLYSKKNQPLDFNHAVHAKIADDGCETCHFLRADGSFSGIPELVTCMICHRKIEKAGVSEKILVTEFIKPQIEIPWLSYSRQPDHVFFSHAAHIQLGGLQCETCHGETGKSHSPKTYQENRLTGYSRDIWGRDIFMSGFGMIGKETGESMRMDDCVECHLKKGHRNTSVQTEKEGCFVCHK